jgi:hypothetical protein
MAGLRQPHCKMTTDGARAENTNLHWVESPVWKGQTMGSFQQACARRNRSPRTKREDHIMITAIGKTILDAAE